MASDANDLQFGALFDGLTVSLALYGLSCGQTFQYFRLFPADSWRLKTLIAFLWSMESFHSILLVHNAWHYLIQHQSSSSMKKANWSLILQVVPTELMAAIIDSFFIYRLWILSERSRKTLILLVPTILAFCFSVAYVIKFFRMPLFIDGLKDDWLLGLFSGFRAIVDILIAAGMCRLLYRQRSGFARSNSLIRRIVNYTVASGLLTSLVTVSYIITFFVMPDDMVYIGVYFVHGNVYFNSILVALNSRKTWRQKANEEISLSEAV